jgi:hypothetical protein
LSLLSGLQAANGILELRPIIALDQHKGQVDQQTKEPQNEPLKAGTNKQHND